VLHLARARPIVTLAKIFSESVDGEDQRVQRRSPARGSDDFTLLGARAWRAVADRLLGAPHPARTGVS